MANGGHERDGGLPPGGVPDGGERITLPRPDTVTFAVERVYHLREVRWVTTEAYCGDEVRLEAVVQYYPPRAPATIEVLHVQTGATLATLSATVEGGRIDATWTAKAPSANWRTDTVRFRIDCPNLRLSGTSSNTFRFRQRPTTDWILLDVDHPTNNGFAPVVELHDARLETDRVHYSLKLRLFGDPFGPAKRLAAKNLIQNVWNGQFASRRFHRVGCQRGRTCDCPYDCCKAGFRFDVNFVDSGEHVAVEIVVPVPPETAHRSGMGRNNSHWGDPPLSPGASYPHECGHVLGQFDEYPEGGTDPSGVQPAPPPASEQNLMSTPGNTTLLNRHYRRVLAFLNAHASGDRYEIIPPGP